MLKKFYHISSYALLALLTMTQAACNMIDEEELKQGEPQVHLALTVGNPYIPTRMSSAVVQEKVGTQTDNDIFRGISDLILLPFRSSGNATVDCISGNDQFLNLYFSNGQNNATSIPSGTTTTNTPTQIYNDNGGANSTYYLKQPLPKTTNAFLAYGRATTGDNNTPALKHANGVLKTTGLGLDASTLSGNINGIGFSPVQMVTAPTSDGAAGAKGNAITAYLNTIFNGDWTLDDYPLLSSLYPLVEDMKAGSSASVQAFVQQIYDALKAYRSVGYVEDVLKAILDPDPTDGTVPDLPATLPTPISLPTACQGYPADLGLPDGAAVIEWDATDTDPSKWQFKAVTSENNLGAMNVNVTQFTFPAELWYRTNSRIHTSEVQLTDPEAQAKTIFNRARWGNLDSDPVTSVLKQKYGDVNLFTANGTVTGNTTIVAVTEPMQYAVARLDVKVKASLATLVDKVGTSHPASDLKITGVLIGQQYPVDYCFHSTWTTGEAEYVIYDNQMTTPDQTLSTTASSVNHTLVLETPKDRPVNIAIEFENVGDDNIFTGSDDTAVPPGCRFYLVGQLTASNGTNYDVDDDTKNRVFCQDHVTDVTFSVNSLANGYYVIPSLSSSELKFSLGVIDWKFSTPASAALK